VKHAGFAPTLKSPSDPPACAEDMQSQLDLESQARHVQDEIEVVSKCASHANRGSLQVQTRTKNSY